MRLAIDPLFRSAVRVYGPRVVGVIITGLLDDDTAALITVKMAGGLAAGQDPAEADFPDIPRSVLRYLEVDYCLPLTKIAPTLVRLAQGPVTVEDPDRPPDREDRTTKALPAGRVPMPPWRTAISTLANEAYPRRLLMARQQREHPV